MAGRSARGLASALVLALAAGGCAREPSGGGPADAGAPPPDPTSSTSDTPGAKGAEPGSTATGAGAAGTPAGAVVDPDPLPEAERRAIAGQIAFVSERDGNPEVYLIRPSGEERRLTRSPGAEFPAAPAPDGAALLLVSVEEDAERKLHLEQLVVQPLDGGPPRAIGPRVGRARNPSWSPDGRWLAFECDVESFSDIYRIAPDGSGLLRLTRSAEGNFEPALSPDGAQIAFVSSRDGDPEVYRMRADGALQQRLTAFHREDYSPRWSPDGKRLAFVSDREGRERIFVMAPDGTRLSALTSSCPAPDARGLPHAADAGASPPPRLPGEIEPTWAPDGKRIAYITRGPGTKPRLWVADLITGACTPVTSADQGAEAPAWSPDGRYLAFTSSRAGDPDLYLMRADGTGQTRLTHAKGSDWLPRWIPPARRVAR